MKRLKLTGLILAAGLCLTACSPRQTAPQPVSRSGFYFDTVITMTVYTGDDALITEAMNQCGRYDALLSKTREDSDVWRLNHADGVRTKVSPETRDILEKAIEYSALSSGAFDVTVEPCVALWDFTADAPSLPSLDEMAQAVKRVDWSQIDINDDGVYIPAGMSVDLGAIAKGYITDRIAQLLRDGGVTSALLNFGGNVYVIGGKPDGSAWSIGVQDPNGAQQQDVMGAVAVRDKAVVTSGIYERGFDLDGARYHHILDPATGWPVQNQLAGVTIVADQAFDADALSTAVFVLGPEAGRQLVESLDGVEAIFVARDETVSFTSGLGDIYTPMK